jgi:predicted Rossmann-fold nucleotide-binding protein
VLDVEGYWQPLIRLLDHAVSEGFLPAKHRGMLLAGTQPDALLDALEAWQPLDVPKWLDRDRT